MNVIRKLSPVTVGFSYELSSISDRQDFLRAAAQTLLALIGGDVAGWSLVDTSAQRSEIAFFPKGHDEKFVADELGEAADDHPMIVSYLRNREDKSPRRLSDACSRRELIRTRTYAQLFRPTSVHHQLTIITGEVSMDNARGWAINRSGHDFTDRDLEVAQGLQPLLRVLDHTRDLPGARRSDKSADMAAQLHLTDRELEVLCYVDTGLTADAIGHLLRISGRTVRKHLENTYRKLDCHDRLLAVQRARALGLLETTTTPPRLDQLMP
jgi:DNA-binding NarL/FixJ family response regulator